MQRRQKIKFFWQNNPLWMGIGKFSFALQLLRLERRFTANESRNLDSFIALLLQLQLSEGVSQQGKSRHFCWSITKNVTAPKLSV